MEVKCNVAALIWVDVNDSLPEPGKPLLATNGKTFYRAVWVPEKWGNEDTLGSYEDGEYYDEDSDCYYWPQGWYEWNENEEVHYQMDVDVTHWALVVLP